MRIVCLLFGLMPAACLAQPIVWDFEGPESGWRPRADTVTVEIERGVGPTGGETACLRVRGPIDVGWNYAVSDPHALTAGKLYRMSVWLRVDSLSPAAPAPFVKCEFVAADDGAELGRANTSAYDMKRLGEWQLLTCEFRAPEAVVSCWLALEKGATGAMEIDACLDDARVEEIDHLSILDRYRVDPTPPSLEATRGVHPRLFLTPERVTELRAAIETTHRRLWEEIRSEADAAADKGPPEYILEDSYSGEEQLWQRDVGNVMPVLAMAWLLSGDTKYLDGARDWALASCGYPTWGLGSIDGMDLAAGHQLLGLSIVYDWCYDDLGDEARATIRETLVRRTGVMFEAAVGGKVWWRDALLQNHLWVNVCGMSAAGFALWDETEDADLWIGYPLDRFRATMDALGPDGASHEGVGYWQYGAEYLMKFAHLSRELLGEDLLARTEWWPNTAAYCAYLMLPRNTWTGRQSIVDIADCPRSNWYGPDHILRGLARESRDGHAQWLAERIDAADIEAASARWLNLIWYDPSVAPVPPDDLPTLRWFEDMGIVSARSGWSGDESLVVLKSGPFIGHEAIEAFDEDPGGGHVHPDAGHFVIFGDGDWLLRDDGYRAKWTGQHNTLLVDGKGQLGEGKHWFDGSACLAARAEPTITRVETSPDLDRMTASAADAYPDDLGLTRFDRTLLYLKPNVLVVLDEIEAAPGSDLELRFHPEATTCERSGEAFLMRGERATLRLEVLTAGSDVTSGDVQGEDRGGGDAFSMFTIRVRRAAPEGAWRNVTALSWAPAGEEPPTVTHRMDGGSSVFTVGQREVRFEWGQ